MPELPEVETTVRGLEPVLQDAVIERVILHRARICAGPFPRISASASPVRG
jgi:formamidopyrimidine-DNA glycosylase